jgi:hypothetical protein
LTRVWHPLVRWAFASLRRKCASSRSPENYSSDGAEQNFAS